MGVEAGQSGRRSRYAGVRIPAWERVSGIATFLNLGARLEPFGFAARTEADGIDIPSFCCQREGNRILLRLQTVPHYFQHSVTLCAELGGCNSS